MRDCGGAIEKIVSNKNDTTYFQSTISELSHIQRLYVLQYYKMVLACTSKIIMKTRYRCMWHFDLYLTVVSAKHNVCNIGLSSSYCAFPVLDPNSYTFHVKNITFLTFVVFILFLFTGIPITVWPGTKPITLSNRNYNNLDATLNS